MAHITIVDKPCGYGKSTEIENSFDNEEKYIIVVPFLSEVRRFKENALRKSGFSLIEPTKANGNKSEHCERLIRQGQSIACTHALFYRLGTIATKSARQSLTIEFNGVDAPKVTTKNLLCDYNIIIDEVVDPFEIESSVRQVDFDEDYIVDGLVEIHSDGRVEPTLKWDRKYQNGSKTFRPDLYEKAKSGALYKVSASLFVITIPTELLLGPKSVTIYTYLSEGSVLQRFLHKLRKDHPGQITLDHQKLDPQCEREWRQDVARALTVSSIPELEQESWTYNAQMKEFKKRSKLHSIGHRLRQLKLRELKDVDLNTVMLTCARGIWYDSKSGDKPVAGPLAKHTRMFGHPIKKVVHCGESDRSIVEWVTTGVYFVPNSTRGTNAYSTCTTAIYLYDQNPNPQIFTFLGLKRDSFEAQKFSDAYALTELVQWLFRSAIRVGGINGTGGQYQPRSRVVAYISCARMRNLLLNWLLTGLVSSAPVKPRNQQDFELLAELEGRTVAMAA